LKAGSGKSKAGSEKGTGAGPPPRRAAPSPDQVPTARERARPHDGFGDFGAIVRELACNSLMLICSGGVPPKPPNAPSPGYSVWRCQRHALRTHRHKTRDGVASVSSLSKPATARAGHRQPCSHPL
jgi:hypothetical protein